MSAHIVSQHVIGYIVNAGIHYGVISRHTAISKARMLWKENQNSIYARYGDDDDYGNIGEITKHRHLGVFLHFDPYQVILSCRNLDYQSCEHREWPNTHACQLLEDIITAVEERHGISRDDEPGSSVWGAPEPKHMTVLEIPRGEPVLATA